MAFYCESCKFIYPKKYANCPKCGYRIKADNLTDDDLLSRGYTLFGAKKNLPPINTTSDSHRNQSTIKPEPTTDNNTFDEIRAMFESGNTTATNNNPAKKNTDTTTTTIRPNPQKNKISSTDNNDAVVSDTGGSFFDNLDAPEFRIEPVAVPKIFPTPVEPSKPTQPQGTVQTPTTPTEPTYDENLFSNTTNTRPRTNTLRDILSRFNSFRARHPIHIPWHLIRRLLPYILIISIAIAIWVSRELIVNAVMEFIVGLIPIAITIGVIVYIIKLMFRR